MEKTQRSAWYAAFQSKDERFDGRIFIGVTSTGIYCRPVCRARLPKEENCLFFSTAAEAEKAGFRPCLICRPELAPGMSASDAKATLAKRTARCIEENCGDGADIEALAARLGYTGRHLRRAFTEEYHVTPVEYRGTCRLLLAKGLLTDTALPITDVALAAGFGSVRRFNALFLQKYRLSPSGFRRRAAAGKAAEAETRVALGYRPPYAWARMLRFLAARAIPGVESVADNEYRRVVRLADKNGRMVTGWIRVRNCPERNVLSVGMSESLLPVLPQLLGRVRNLFDLGCDPCTVGESLKTMEAIRPGAFVAGLRVPGCIEPFELCVRAVLGQQITVKAAGTLAGKVAAAFGTPVATGIPGLSAAFPSAEDILALDGAIEAHFGPLGIIVSRARTIRAIAVLLRDQPMLFAACADPAAEMKRLTEIPGVGPWTAKYIAMRAMQWTDAMMETDLGIRKALCGMKPAEIAALCEQWKPWRSYATMALWDWLHMEEGGAKG